MQISEFRFAALMISIIVAVACLLLEQIEERDIKAGHKVRHRDYTVLGMLANLKNDLIRYLVSLRYRKKKK